MLSHWSDLERTFTTMDQLRRRMEQVFSDIDAADVEPSAGWPRVDLYDTGKALVLTAELPGVAEKDLQLTLTQDVLSLAGERRVDVPAGYVAHRQERLPRKFSRSFTLPTAVDSDAIVATLKDGVLSVTMPKAPESQPRQIAINNG